jgi:hypothetical protein
MVMAKVEKRRITAFEKKKWSCVESAIIGWMDSQKTQRGWPDRVFRFQHF